MKTFIFGLVVVGMMCVFVFTGCEQPEYNDTNNESAVGKILEGEHNIRALTTHTTTTGNLNGGYFLFVGDIHGNITSSTELRFAWLGNDGDYVITDLPLSKIKLRIDNRKSTPSVKFRWSPYNWTSPEEIKDHIVYAVIVCSDKDMPQQTGENLQNIFKSE